MIEYFEVYHQDRSLRGMLHTNSKFYDFELNPVIIVHGYFSANKIGPNRLYFELANQLSEIGFPVLRIDLSAMGESDGRIEEIDFSDHISDIYACIDALQNRFRYDCKIHLIGHCIGCCNVLKQCSVADRSLDTVTIVCPFMPSEIAYRKLLGNEQFDSINRVGWAIRKGVYCRKSFIDAGYMLYNINIESALKHDLFVYIAEIDEYSEYKEIEEWCILNRIPNQIIPSADHNFTNPTARKELFDSICNRFWRMRK